MVNVNGGRDWSAATKDCPEFLGSLTQVKYFSTNLITVRAHRGHTWSEATQNPCKFYHLSVSASASGDNLVFSMMRNITPAVS